MRFILILFSLFLTSCVTYTATNVGEVSTVLERQIPLLTKSMKRKGLRLGAPAYVRVFKEGAALELWVKPDDRDQYKLFRRYRICNFSGKLGPKQRQGDMQSPEGFYKVSKKHLRNYSNYHMAFDMGFPNAYDRSHSRTGSLLLIHGDCQSIGCYAMTDAGIEEIHTVITMALRSGQNHVPVHAFPFRMTETKLAQYKDNQWYEFWSDLKLGYDAFQKTKRPPVIDVVGKRYVVR